MQQSAEAELARRPVDLIFVVDNSGSMTPKIQQVVEQLNGTLYETLEKAGADYQVTVVSAAGRLAERAVCLVEPLGAVPDPDGAGVCSPDIAGQIVESGLLTAERFTHVPQRVDSHDGLCQLLRRLAQGDLDHLRTDATKNVAIVTDDFVECQIDYLADGAFRSVRLGRGAGPSTACLS